MKFLSLFLVFFLSDKLLATDFPLDYAHARKQFRQTADSILANENFGQGLLDSIRVESPKNENLTIDYLYLPARDVEAGTKRLVILTSGVHGVEAFAGSFVQVKFLKEQLRHFDFQKAGLLVMHTLNPWGFKHERRVTERNVDLNRNFDTTYDLFKSSNELYDDELDRLLNPKLPIVSPDAWQLKSPLQVHLLGELALKLYTNKLVQKAVTAGQYIFKKGLFFGGKKFEPQVEEIGEVIRKIASPYKDVFVGDLHTGYGEKGVLHFFGLTKFQVENALLDPEKVERHQMAQKRLFDGFAIEGGNEGQFYVTNGDFTQYVLKLLSDKLVLSMTLEFGTMGLSTKARLVSLMRTRLENQGKHWGYADAKSESAVKRRFLEVYNPTDPQWRQSVRAQTDSKIVRVIDRFTKGLY